MQAQADGRPRPLRIGLLLPQMERAMAGRTPRWRDLARMAAVAEDAGFDSVWVIDHLVVHERDADGLRRAKGLWECWSLLAALAATTTRVRIGSLVSPLAFRNPALLAKMADTVQEISDGRLVLGVGAGSYLIEHEVFGLPSDRLVARFEEAVTIVRTLLRDGAIDFDGVHHQVRGCELRPRPRAGAPPIVIGTLRHRPRMLRLVAEHADAWNVWLAFGRSSADRIPPIRAAGDAACAAVGRDPASLARSACVLVDDSDGRIWGTDVPVILRDRKRVEALRGSHQDIAAGLLAFAREGVGELQIALSPNTPEGVEHFSPVLGLLRRAQETVTA
jgi:alkanesulfonate monooxygenase SsuD/methylene tetrahydromethanopterin reductase-like flavin-dependent oxidoreductase (luciferase family)